VRHAVCELDGGERLFGPLLALDRGDARVDERQLDVVQGRRAREQVEGLEDEADLLLRMRASSSSSMSETSLLFIQ
jgi:hypothetical protein